MTLDELLQENKDILIHMKNEDDIYRMARNYWDFDVIPPKKYTQEILNYIHDHPEYFKGLSPQ